MNYTQKTVVKVRIILSLALIMFGGYHFYQHQQEGDKDVSHETRADPSKTPQLKQEYHLEAQKAQTVQCYDEKAKEMTRRITLKTRNLVIPVQ